MSGFFLSVSLDILLELYCQCRVKRHCLTGLELGFLEADSAKADMITLWEHLLTATTTASTVAVSAFDDLSAVAVRQGPRLMHRDALVLTDSKSLCYFCGILQMNCPVVCMRNISHGLMDLNVWSSGEGSVWGVYGIRGR